MDAQQITAAETYDVMRPPEEVAEEMGMDLLMSKPDQLQLDIDNDSDFAHFLNMVEHLQQDGVVVGGWQELRSKSGNRHVLVKLTRVFTVPERIMLQALLGSDRVRETFNYQRWLRGMLNPICLFRPRGVDFDDELPF